MKIGINTEIHLLPSLPPTYQVRWLSGGIEARSQYYYSREEAEAFMKELVDNKYSAKVHGSLSDDH